jgi:hypothetical protein
MVYGVDAQNVSDVALLSAVALHFALRTRCVKVGN